VDIEQGRVVSGSPNVRQWRGADITGDLSRELNGELGVKIFVDNDANAMALAEHSFGAGKGHNSGLYLTVGTGLGSGIILGNKMWRGSTYAGAELGHSIIVKGGYPCQCGKRGCLEMYVNAESFVRFYGERAPKLADSKWVFDRARLGDPHAVSAIRKSADYLACGIGSALEILNPEVVVIGGGVALGGRTYFNAVRRFLRQYASKASYHAVKVLPAQLGNFAGVLGAALLPLEHRLL
jgi:glucokinase